MREGSLSIGLAPSGVRRVGRGIGFEQEDGGGIGDSLLARAETIEGGIE